MPAAPVVLLAAALLTAARTAPIAPPKRGNGAAATPTPPATPGEAFERGRIAFGRGEWARAIQILRPLLYPELQLENDEQVVQAHRMLGVALLFEGQRDEARQELTRLLELRPDFRFDPLLDPAPVVDFFNSILREREAQIAELEARRRAAEEAERRAEAERAPPRIVERRIERHSYLLSFVPFGAGQFQNGQRRKGVFFLAAESVLAAASVGAFATNFALYGFRSRLSCQKTPDQMPATTCVPEMVDRDPQDVSALLFRVQIVTGGLFFAVVAWGIVDAVMNFRPEVALPDEPRRTAGRTLQLAPILIGDVVPTPGAGLFWRF